MHSLDSNVLYVLNNSDIEYKLDGKKFKNTGLDNFIRIYKFIPYGVNVIKRRKRMAKATKVTKKVTKKAPAKKAMVKKAPAKKATAKK